MLHKLDHVVNLDKAGETLEFIGSGKGIGVVIFADLGDANAAVVGREGVLVVREDFLVELFARAETTVFDLDVFVWSEAGETDHSSGKVIDLD